MVGIFHPFTFYTTPSSCTALYQMHVIDFIFEGEVTASLIDVVTGLPVTLTNTIRTWSINGVDYKATRVTGSVGASKYLFKIVLPGTGGTFYDGVIEKGSIICDVGIITANDCSNEWYDWTADPGEILLLVGNSGFDLPAFNTATTIKIENGLSSEDVVLKPRETIIAIAPNGYNTILNAVKTNKTKKVNGKDVINFNVEREEINEDYSRFTISFEYPKPSNNLCCDLLNIDNIAIGGGVGGGDCDTFAVEIINTAGTLTASITDLPNILEPVIYRWYKNGSYLTGATSVGSAGVGTYKLVLLNDGCTANATTQIQSECAAMVVSPYIVGNQLNANITNPPVSYTISIKKDGVELATSLPYTMVASGTYFVHIVTATCQKSGGVPFVLPENVDCDFTLSIVKSGSILTAITDASAPTYKWKLDKGDGLGALEVGSAATYTVVEDGVYFLEVKNGTCTQDVYLYLKPAQNKFFNALYRSNGSVFTVFGINFTDFDPNDYTVLVNSGEYTYTPSTPTLSTQWSFNVANQLVLSPSHPVTNALIIIKKLN